MLNFGHGMYVDTSQNRLYLATLFTNQNNVITTNSDTAVGSIAIFDNISSLTGAQTPTRHIFGDLTQITQPHGVWVDESRDIMYVANTFGQSILVFENASTIDGNVAPDRVITHDSLGAPVYIFIDPMVDRMFVTSMTPMGMGMPPVPNSQVLVYNNASTLDGNSDPALRITGNNTRLDLINKTVHNTWFNPGKELLAVGHHTNELLLFNLKGTNWNPSTTKILNIAPRVIRVDDPTLGYDSVDVNLYGFFWDVETDRMFCSVGIDNHNGGPMVGSAPNAIKIFSNVSDSTLSGIVEPDRVIYWDNGTTYFPPQPIWVHKTQEITTGIETTDFNKIRIYPNPSASFVNIDFGQQLNEKVDLILSNTLGQVIRQGQAYQSVLKYNISGLENGIYLLQIKSDDNSSITVKIVKN